MNEAKRVTECAIHNDDASWKKTPSKNPSHKHKTKIKHHTSYHICRRCRLDTQKHTHRKLQTPRSTLPSCEQEKTTTHPEIVELAPLAHVAACVRLPQRREMFSPSLPSFFFGTLPMPAAHTRRTQRDPSHPHPSPRERDGAARASFTHTNGSRNHKRIFARPAVPLTIPPRSSLVSSPSRACDWWATPKKVSAQCCVCKSHSNTPTGGVGGFFMTKGPQTHAAVRCESTPTKRVPTVAELILLQKNGRCFCAPRHAPPPRCPVLFVQSPPVRLRGEGCPLHIVHHPIPGVTKFSFSVCVCPPSFASSLSFV